MIYSSPGIASNVTFFPYAFWIFVRCYATLFTGSTENTTSNGKVGNRFAFFNGGKCANGMTLLWSARTALREFIDLANN
jgi:hypothetical protein